MYLLMTCYHSNLELLHVRIAQLCWSVSFLYPCTYNNYVYLSLSNCMIFSVIIPVKVPDFHNLYDQLFIFNWIHTKLSNIDILVKQLGKCQVLLSLKDCPRAVHMFSYSNPTSMHVLCNLLIKILALSHGSLVRIHPVLQYEIKQKTTMPTTPTLTIT